MSERHSLFITVRNVDESPAPEQAQKVWDWFRENIYADEEDYVEENYELVKENGVIRSTNIFADEPDGGGYDHPYNQEGFLSFHSALENYPDAPFWRGDESGQSFNDLWQKFYKDENGLPKYKIRITFMEYNEEYYEDDGMVMLNQVGIRGWKENWVSDKDVVNDNGFDEDKFLKDYADCDFYDYYIPALCFRLHDNMFMFDNEITAFPYDDEGDDGVEPVAVLAPDGNIMDPAMEKYSVDIDDLNDLGEPRILDEEDLEGAGDEVLQRITGYFLSQEEIDSYQEEIDSYQEIIDAIDALEEGGKLTVSIKKKLSPASLKKIGETIKAKEDCLITLDLSEAIGLEEIWRDTFYGCDSLESVTIPGSVTKIGDCAFSDCTSLVSVTIPAGVTKIGKFAFCDCESLESVTIPDSLTKIGDSAFYDCESLESVTIPGSLTKIGDSAFSDCKSLESITVADGNEVYDSRNGCNAIIKTATNTLIVGCKNTVIPESVTKIEKKAFSGCASLASVTIPDGVTEIGWAAFDGCASLASVTIPAGVTKIWGLSFRGCASLTLVTIPGSVTEIGSQTFSGCTSLASVTIPESVTEIGDEAFHGCAALASIMIPEGVTKIGNKAFDGCTSLVSVTIPSSVTEIGDEAFHGCAALASIMIPEGVTKIGDKAFMGGCASLESIAVADGNKVYDSRNNCNAIIETATNTLIVGCKNTVIPASVKEIGDSAFRGCSSLASIEIPAGVSAIGKTAFNTCASLESITVADGNKVYDSRNNCNAIIETATNTLIVGCKNTVIPESVTKIGGCAFFRRSSLSSITIPLSVTEIGQYAFSYCESLKTIKITGEGARKAAEEIANQCGTNPEIVVAEK